MAKKFSIADYIQGGEGVSNLNTMEITMVPFERIFQNWRNFYAVDNAEEDLAESIRVSGLLTPLGVVRDGADDRFKLISGHRRWRALRYLRDTEPDGREKWGAVPCVVYASPEDADREMLMLIHANAQRVKTGPELAQEARETLAILTRMKERGVELPGRMRDRVAEAMKISGSRLARIEAIQNNLSAGSWQEEWIGGALSESAAYRLSQCSREEQAKLWNHFTTAGIRPVEIGVKRIEAALELFYPKVVQNGPLPEPEKVVQFEPLPEELTRIPEPDPVFAALDWKTGTPPADGRYLCLVDMDRAGIPDDLHEQTLDLWNGAWLAYGRPVDDMFDVVGWWPLPKKWERYMPVPGQEEKEDDEQ